MLNVAYFDTLQDAMAESHRRRAAPDEQKNVIRILGTGYGGFKVMSIPADFFVESITDSSSMGGVWPDLERKRAQGYG